MAAITEQAVALLRLAGRGVARAAESPPPSTAPRPMPADQQYLRTLIGSIVRGRLVVPTYNAVLLLVLLVFSLQHWRQHRRDYRRWRARLGSCGSGVEEAKDVTGVEEFASFQYRSGLGSEDESPATSSSSSSTLQGSATPPGLKDVDASFIDLESLPLLHRKQSKHTNGGASRSTLRKVQSTAAGWLARQPRPMPLINRTLPSHSTSLFVLAWLGVNAFYQLSGVPMTEARYLFAVADRAGLVFIVNLPLLYVLAAKNQPVELLTGRSYEALNIFHRRVGELMCFAAFIHAVGLLLWRGAFAPDFLAESSFTEFLTHRIVILGLGAFFSYELLFLTSLGSFRRRWYELFLASHVFLQIVALVFLWLHYHTARPYVAVALLVFVVDRIVWRFRLKSVRMTADLDILEDGETIMLSADWDLHEPMTQGQKGSSSPRTITHGWRPTDHVFLTVPALGRTHALQTHPFTIASAAPPIPSWTESGPDAAQPSHAWFNLLIRAQTGFTADLLAHARLNRRVDVRLDGPYGSQHALDLSRASDTVIFVAGGSGIAVVLPLASALLLQDAPRYAAGRKQKVYMLWVVHSRSHRSWVPEERFEELVEAGLELVVPEPTAVAGRPDISGFVDGWVKGGEARGDEMGVVVSGPDGMNRTVRNVCADAIGTGAKVRVAVEKFGW